MTRITLTDFVDIVSKSGVSKATKIHQIQNREYSPQTDFYKIIRDKIINIHKHNLGKNAIDAILIDLLDIKKLNTYPILVHGYKKWWGRKNIEWYDPPNEIVQYGKNLELSINPELGLLINNNPYLIKLYFKSEALSKNKMDIILETMKLFLEDSCPENTIMGVLDIRESKIFVPTISIPGLDKMIRAELAYISTLLR